MMFDYRSIFDLRDRTALVVGAGSGIGQASAVGLAAFGASVHCADIDLQAARETARLIVEGGEQGQAVSFDMRDSQQITAALEKIGPVDILISTPSINVRKPILEIAEEEFDCIISLNLKGTFLLIKAVARGMAERERGSIVVFSSIRSAVVEPGQGIYAATKAGITQMVRTLAAELGPKGVRVNAIAPGVVETPLTAQIKNHPEWYQAYAQKSALKRWAQPQEIVGAVIFLASEASSYITGSLMFVDGGWTAIDGRFTPPL
jgi:NAD(P)-dependent dehydrogenase (short-subunit alcohol dehydrogenase family)